ncbi:MAG TPA: hypothetical protein VIQ31_17370 [Phormidium sp.]
MKAKTGRPKKNFYIGLDAGNGWIKMVFDDSELRIPSYKSSRYISESIGSVKDGETQFTVGKAAVYDLLHDRSSDRTVDAPSAKLDHLEELYLGALAHYENLPNEMMNRIVVSTHAWANQTHKQTIKDALNKSEKTVTLSGKEVKLTTEVMLIMPEGYGAVHEEKGDFATLDFGNGTTILTPYVNAKPTEPIVENYGVQNLIRLVSRETAAINGGNPISVDFIRTAIERGDLKVGDTLFKDIYKKCLAEWWNKGLESVRTKAALLVQDNTRVICIGGGVSLPLFAGLLKQKNFEPKLDRPEMLNARGLQKIAQIRGGVNA